MFDFPLRRRKYPENATADKAIGHHVDSRLLCSGLMDIGGHKPDIAGYARAEALLRGNVLLCRRCW
jgi:hypothetical protein